jgi:hypothetical protein
MIVVGSDFPDKAGLHAFIKDNAEIPDWWHYLDTCYLICTSIGITPMQTILTKRFPNQYLFIVDIHPHYGGWLPSDAWKWLEKYNRFTTHTAS